MTYKKKAEELGWLYHIPCYLNVDCEYEARQAALEMAEWMIEKACGWLKENIKDYLSCDGYSDAPGFKQYVSEDFYEDFKKAMEE